MLHRKDLKGMDTQRYLPYSEYNISISESGTP